MYRVGISTYYQIIAETSKIMSAILTPIYVHLPTREGWLQIAYDFEEKWNFPNRIGALDGKHVRIKKPTSGGSIFFNYKKFLSIVLMAISDAHCRFTWYTVGDGGSFSDPSVFNNSTFYNKLLNDQLFIPAPRLLTNSNTVSPYVFVGDEIFGLGTHLMKPYNRRLLRSVEERIFNYGLSQARFTIECAFGILSSKFKICNGPLYFNLDTNISIISACICLHNMIISRGLGDHDDNAEIGRHIEVNNGENILERPIIIRQQLAHYFLNEGAVPWQNNYV